MMCVGLAADHGGYELKTRLAGQLKSAGYEVRDFGNYIYDAGDDYPDYVIPLADAVSSGQIIKGIAVCGSGVGVCVAANKITGVRAALIMDPFSARQGVEDDNINVICLGGRVIGYSLAWELVKLFLEARFSGFERHIRRLGKVADEERVKSNA